jgi:Uma2 family endonuclease
MSHALAEVSYDWNDIIANIATEDDEPVDNLFSEKQQTLLKRSLYASWTPPRLDNKPRKFLAAANVGIFYSRYEPPLVPDFFLSLDVEPHEDWYKKEHRTYFVYEFGKAPELALEIVSNRVGGEINGKLKKYAQMGVIYYVVYDPQQLLGKGLLIVYELGFGRRLRPRKDTELPELELSLRLWNGTFEGKEGTWLRWYDAKGHLIQTGEERVHQAETLTAKANARAITAEKRAAQAEAELKKLRAEMTQLQTKSPAKSARKRSSK